MAIMVALFPRTSKHLLLHMLLDVDLVSDDLTRDASAAQYSSGAQMALLASRGIVHWLQ